MLLSYGYFPFSLHMASSRCLWTTSICYETSRAQLHNIEYPCREQYQGRHIDTLGCTRSYFILGSSRWFYSRSYYGIGQIGVPYIYVVTASQKKKPPPDNNGYVLSIDTAQVWKNQSGLLYVPSEDVSRLENAV